MVLHVAARPLLTAMAVAIVAISSAASTAQAGPVALGKSDVPGAKAASVSAKTFRTALLASMRGGPRGAVKSAPVVVSAYRAGATRVLSGSVSLRSDASAKAVAKASGARTSITRKTSSATASVQVGRIVGFVSVQIAGKDPSVRAAADAYATALKAQILAASQTVADQLAEDSTYSKAQALSLFQIAYGGMPGAKVPAGERGRLDDGTLAGSRVYRLLDQLTPAQRAAFSDAIEGGEPVAAPAQLKGHAARKPAKKPKPSTLVPDPTWQTAADAFAATYAGGAYVGRALPFPIKVFRSKANINAAADAFPVDAAGKLNQAAPAYCRIRLDAYFYKRTPTYQRWIVAHETFHCIEFSITTNWGGTARDWVIEGMASWAATQLVVDTTNSENYFASYLFKPGLNLFDKSYSATGFWGHLNERNGSFWPKVVATLQGGDNAATFAVAGGSTDSARLTEASRYVRDAASGDAWNTSQPNLIPAAAAPTPRAVNSAATATLTAPAYTQKLIDLLPTSKTPVVEITRASGNVRFTDGASDYPDSASMFFCLGGRCECPPDETASLPPGLVSVSKLTAALAGETGGGLAVVRRHSMKEYCSKDKTPPRIGSGGPGGSNGDPHLTSLDGLKFDFQAAGEFVLAKSGTDLEIQGRQEPWKLGSTVIRTVTINTQFGLRVGSGRATLSPGKTPQLRVDGGAPQELAAGAQVAIGIGRATSDGEQITVAWPDGSTATIWSVGEWGLAISLDLAGTRSGNTLGLLGNFDGSPYDDLRTRAGKVTAFKAAAALWPGVSRVQIDDPTDPKFADKLYDVVGDSWRIAQKESLLDYAKGQSTKTFTDQSIPRKLVEPADVTAKKRQDAEAICRAAGVTAPAALEDCILDVALTGQAAFATAAAKEEALTSIAWTRLAAGGTRYGPVSLARTGDGTLHLVWEDKDGAEKRSIVAAGLPAAGGERAPVTVAPFDTTPYAFTAPDGGLRMVGSVIDAATPVTEGIVQFGSSAPFDRWSARPMVVTPGAYVGEPMATFVGDTMLTVSGLNGGGKIYRNTGTGSGGGLPLNGALSADCYAMKPSIASSGSETYTAFWQWDCPQTGLFVAPVDPATGKPGDEIAVPQSAWTGSVGATAWDAPGLDRLSLAARPGGGLFLAYARQDGDLWSILLWRVGSAAPMTVASGLSARPDSLQVSAEPTTGNLWVAYESQDAAFGKGRLAVRRTNQTADGWDGSARQVAFPADGDVRAAPSHPWDVLARDGSLDIVAGYPATSEYPGALWRGVLAG